MNFLIFRDFFEIFVNLFFIFNVKNNLKMAKKMGSFLRGTTWMRRGTHGHVAEPRGPTQAPAWCDVTGIYIYIILPRVIVHISIP